MVKYVLVLPVENTEGSYEGKLPLHCTLMPPFETSVEHAVLFALLSIICARYSPLLLVSRQSATSARAAEKVHVLQHNPKLHELHAEILKELNKWGVVHAGESYIGEGYWPHVTTTATSDFPPGSACLVEMATILIYEEIPRAKGASRKRKVVASSFPFWG